MMLHKCLQLSKFKCDVRCCILLSYDIKSFKCDVYDAAVLLTFFSSTVNVMCAMQCY